jgi:hypothetical protein
MNKLLQRFSSFLLATLKAISVILGLVGLTFVIAWISGVFTENIQTGE